jgi:hypothetical protein
MRAVSEVVRAALVWGFLKRSRLPPLPRDTGPLNLERQNARRQ